MSVITCAFEVETSWFPCRSVYISNSGIMVIWSPPSQKIKVDRDLVFYVQVHCDILEIRPVWPYSLQSGGPRLCGE